MSKINKFNEKATLYISIFLILILLAIVAFQVFIRQVFGISYMLLDEINRILFAWCISSSVAYAFIRKAHVSVNYFYEKITVQYKQALYIIILLFILVFLLFLMKHSWLLTIRQMRIPFPISSYPRGYLFIPLPISCLIMCISVLNEIYELFCIRRQI
jgi:TRAP-type transport system small permease protein